jgi:hypothetical protein
MAFEGKKYCVNGIEMNVAIEGQGSDLVLVTDFRTRSRSSATKFRSWWLRATGSSRQTSQVSA